jgi:type III secretory pathway lipoprotein EscJ
LVPIASVHYDGFREEREIMAILNAHGIPAAPEGEATVVFPILVSKTKFDVAVSILRTNALVTSGKVRLYTTITREVK